MTNARLRALNGAFGKAAQQQEHRSPGWAMFSQLWNLTWARMRERGA